MGFSDSWNYILSDNPVSKAIIKGSKGAVGGTVALFSRQSNNAANTVTAKAVDITKATMPSLYRLAGRNYNFIRLAGLSGASAVLLGAIGSHSLLPSQEKNDLKVIFETAYRFHFFHSLALMGAPMAKYPTLTGFLMLSGTFLFCGTLYYRAFTGEKRFARYSLIGGVCLILAWLSLML